MGLRICALPVVPILMAVALMLACVGQAQAQPAAIGLVIGNANYASLPALSACVESSQAIANTLRGLGYRVVERQDVTSGGMAAAIGEFSREMEATSDASVFVYVCGYAAGLSERPFLLPVSANIRRPSDVMTQGILAKVLLDVLSRGKANRAVVALDLVTAPDASAPALGSLVEMSAPEGVALIAVTGSPPIAGPTALSVALAAGLAAPGVETGTLLTNVESQLTGPEARIGALRMPSVSRPIAAGEQAAPTPIPTSSTPSPTQPSSTQLKGATVEQVVESPPIATRKSSSLPALPEEGAMTKGERRRVQEALTRIGYYGGGIDGIFGPETRAAIRRFQHEIGVEMTGVISGVQAARLLTWQ